MGKFERETLKHTCLYKLKAFIENNPWKNKLVEMYTDRKLKWQNRLDAHSYCKSNPCETTWEPNQHKHSSRTLAGPTQSNDGTM